VVTVYIMPLGTWLTGSFMTTWGQGRESRGSPGPRRSPEQARQDLESFRTQLEPLLAFRPEWDEEGPPRAATVFSAEGFERPFLQARRWSYRRRMERLCSMELPQLWLPMDFDPVFHLAAPWAPEARLHVASAAGLGRDLHRFSNDLPEELPEESLRELAEAFSIARRLEAIAAVGVEHDVPVIVEV
jgi:hypothetical protein